MRHLFGKKGLRLSQSLGAFRKPNGDISPLFVFFEVENESGEAVEVVRLRVAPKGWAGSVADGGIEGESLPASIPPGESVRFQVRAKTLARALKDAGYGETPKVMLAVEDGEGGEHRKGFKLRVDEYLVLKDE